MTMLEVLGEILLNGLGGLGSRRGNPPSDGSRRWILGLVVLVGVCLIVVYQVCRRHGP